MPSTLDIRVVLEREMCATQKQVVVIAHRLRIRFAGPDIEADDLFQEGMIGAYRLLYRQMEQSPEAFNDTHREALRESIVRIATRVMQNKICDGHRRAYRRPPLSFAEDTDDRMREALSAREELQAIEAVLSGPSLELFRLVLQHGQEDVPALARAIDRSVAQTYRLLHGLKATALQVVGREPKARQAPRRRVGAATIAPG